MKFNNPYFTISEKLSLLQRWILVHSILYYKYNFPIATDHRYDTTCRQYITLRDKHPLEEGRYDYAFEDFDGSTGFDLEARLTKPHQMLIDFDAAFIINMKKTEFLFKDSDRMVT